ncbi:hypothetical protein CRE_15761 [Caenorhabditis remanei]|uniref:Uncharacterized protein n=1 Tax=Caenorhabditis remanei TaxID=31234 RepID=E3NJR5_CAERE|nr:hypothetical protein CRE_15761 [Caenorhabditis remanei]
MNILAFLLLTFSSFLVTHGGKSKTPTYFTSWGTLTCLRPIYWCFFVSYMERDIWTYDDRIDFLGVRCTRDKDYPFFLKGWQYGDEQLSDNFTISLEVTSNCTEDGTIKLLETDRIEAGLDSRHVEMNRTIDLTTDPGTQVPKYH